MNKPYKRSENPQAITKDTPYLSTEPNRRERRMRQRPFNNSGTTSVIVTFLGMHRDKKTEVVRPIFYKVKQRLQLIGRKMVVHYQN
jgi:hypothetical protein